MAEDRKQVLNEDAKTILEEQLCDECPDYSSVIIGMHGLIDDYMARWDKARAAEKAQWERAGAFEHHALKLEQENKRLRGLLRLVDVYFTHNGLTCIEQQEMSEHILEGILELASGDSPSRDERSGRE